MVGRLKNTWCCHSPLRIVRWDNATLHPLDNQRWHCGIPAAFVHQPLGQPMYVKPNTQKRATSHLFISNVGPLFGTTADDIRTVLQPYCSNPQQLLISTPSSTSHFWTVSFTGPQGVNEATAALKALCNQPLEAAAGRVMICKYAKWVSEEGEAELQTQVPVACTTEQADIPGLYIIPNFVSQQEQQELLAHIDSQPWQHLAKRRVQHYGFKFEYSQRGVDMKQRVEHMPDWTHDIVQRLQELPEVPALDQLTVNEYTPGVGIAPHVESHESFTGSIMSLSLLGGCIMVLRKAYKALNPCNYNISSSSDNGACCGSSTNGSSTSSSNTSGSSSQTGNGVDDGQQQDRQVLLYLPPRSLVVMSGEARYAWQHYIPHRKSDWVNGEQVMRAARRVSLTFRKARGYACDCSYPEYCDSQLGKLPPPRTAATVAQDQEQQEKQQAQQQQANMPQPLHRQEGPAFTQQQQEHQGKSNGCSETNSTHCVDGHHQPPAAAESNTAKSCMADVPVEAAAAAVSRGAAQALEDAHVHQVYDVIASHFSSTRFAVWPKVRAFLDSLSPGSVVADVGCGNGKYLGVRRDLAVLGCDRSAGLAAVAAQRLAAGSTGSATGKGLDSTPGADVFVCDALQLCYRPCSCDALLCIAVLHHISSRQRRVALLQQLADVLRPGGRGLVTVWATEQENPGKTIERWHLLQPSGDAQGQMHGAETPPQQLQDVGADAPEAVMGSQPGQQLGGAVEGPDYFVPWHLPFHRAGGLAAQAQAQQQAGTCCSADRGNSSNVADVLRGPAAVSVDESKGAVVLQRFYHLFEEGELEGLVAQVPCLEVSQVFYDRSNWCVEFVKQQPLPVDR